MYFYLTNLYFVNIESIRVLFIILDPTTFKFLKDNGVQIVACTEKADKLLYEMDLNSPLAMVLGSEEDGISPALLNDCDHLARIPMSGNIASLNVSVAAGVCVYEAIRQKHYK